MREWVETIKDALNFREEETSESRGASTRQCVTRDEICAASCCSVGAKSLRKHWLCKSERSCGQNLWLRLVRAGIHCHIDALVGKFSSSGASQFGNNSINHHHRQCAILAKQRRRRRLASVSAVFFVVVVCCRRCNLRVELLIAEWQALPLLRRQGHFQKNEKSEQRQSEKR